MSKLKRGREEGPHPLQTPRGVSESPNRHAVIQTNVKTKTRRLSYSPRPPVTAIRNDGSKLPPQPGRDVSRKRLSYTPKVKPTAAHRDVNRLSPAPVSVGSQQRRRSGSPYPRSARRNSNPRKAVSAAQGVGVMQHETLGHKSPRRLSLPNSQENERRHSTTERGRRRRRSVTVDKSTVSGHTHLQKKLEQRGRSIGPAAHNSKRRVSVGSSRKRKGSHDFFYEQLQQIPKFKLNKTRSEALMDEMARKRVARREYYGNLILERYREHLRRKLEGRGKRKARISKSEPFHAAENEVLAHSEGPTPRGSLASGSDEFVVAHFQSTLAPQSRQGKHKRRVRAASRSQSVSSSTQVLTSSHTVSRHSTKGNRSSLKSVRTANSKPDKIVSTKIPVRGKRFSHKSDHSDKSDKSDNVNAQTLSVKRSSHKSDHSDKSDKSDKAMRASVNRHTSFWKSASGTVIPVARLKTGLVAEELLHELTPLTSRQDIQGQKVISHKVKAPLNHSGSTGTSSDIFQRRRVVTSADLTPNSSLRLRKMDNPKPEDELHYRKIYSHRRSLRLAKIKGQLEAKKKTKVLSDSDTLDSKMSVMSPIPSSIASSGAPVDTDLSIASSSITQLNQAKRNRTVKGIAPSDSDMSILNPRLIKSDPGYSGQGRIVEDTGKENINHQGSNHKLEQAANPGGTYDNSTERGQTGPSLLTDQKPIDVDPEIREVEMSRPDSPEPEVISLFTKDKPSGGTAIVDKVEEPHAKESVKIIFRKKD